MLCTDEGLAKRHKSEPGGLRNLLVFLLLAFENVVHETLFEEDFALFVRESHHIGLRVLTDGPLHLASMQVERGLVRESGLLVHESGLLLLQLRLPVRPFPGAQVVPLN